MLTVNAGSSTLKLSLVDSSGAVLHAATLTAPGGQVDHGELILALASPDLRTVDAVAHRVVHGGTRFHGAVVMSDGVAAELQALSELAPLHQRQGLAVMSSVSALRPELPAVACFDTAFHATIPDDAATYALPQAWRDRWDLRRHGFHGLSHAGVARRFPRGRVVSCHLGAGASLCAISDGESVDTTMGLTPMAGLVMARRPGDVDPGLLLWLLRETGLSVDEVEAALEHESGLRGLTGTADMRGVLAGAESGDGRCILGLAVYAHRLSAGVAAMAAALGGMDHLVFTGGVGEHCPPVRAEAASRLGFLGITLDVAANAVAHRDADISADGSRVSVHVVT
ncbi:MAG: hypothetical protein JHD16_03365, partial [Solirubrobacteraceae bacterium]|nr:hypothetical protein [Solirubrobacteraceae bacterium]